MLRFLSQNVSKTLITGPLYFPDNVSESFLYKKKQLFFKRIRSYVIHDNFLFGTIAVVRFHLIAIIILIKKNFIQIPIDV